MTKQVFLRISPGIMTRKIQIPNQCGPTYRVPILADITLQVVNKMQDMPQMPEMKYLDFEFRGEHNQGIPVLELKYTNL